MLLPTASRRLLVPVLLAVLAVLVCYQSYYCLKLQKSVVWDASMGFLTLQSSLEQGEFNRLRHPAAANLAEDRSEFMVWWTPGQYLIPYWLAQALGTGTDLGLALRLLGLLCSLGGLAGLALLYAKLGFNRVSVLVSLIMISCQEYFLRGSRLYTGGDQLLFLAAPYLVLSIPSHRLSLAARAAIAAAGGLLGIFLKASAINLCFALMLYLVLEAYGWPAGATREPHSRPRRLLVVGVMWGGFVLATYLAYLSRGVTISASARPWASFSPDRLWGIPASFGAPLYGAFSFLEPYATARFFIPMAMVSLAVVWMLDRSFEREGRHDYRRLLVASYLAFALFFSYVFLRGMSVSYEPRHFRFVGLIFLPGLIDRLLRHRYQAANAAVIAALSLGALLAYHRRYNAGPAPVDSSSRWGIRQPVSNATLEALHRIDETRVAENTIVYNGFGACPALLLEFNHGRRFQDDNWVYFSFAFSGRNQTPVPWFRSPAESILFVVPKNTPWYFGPSLAEIAPAFARSLDVVPVFENGEVLVYQGSVR